MRGIAALSAKELNDEVKYILILIKGIFPLFISMWENIETYIIGLIGYCVFVFG